MQLNEIHNPHEHATVSLKVILLVFAVILVGVLGYLVWDYKNTPDAADNTAPTVKKADNSSTEETDETADWKTYTNKFFSFSFKYPSDWVNFYTGTAFNDKDPDRIFGSTTTANKHKDEDSSTVATYLNTDPVILLTYGFYEDNSPAVSLKNYIGNNYDTGTVTDITTDKADFGKKFVGKDTKGNNVIVFAFSLPKRSPEISGQEDGVLFLQYSYASVMDADTVSVLTNIVRTLDITN